MDGDLKRTVQFLIEQNVAIVVHDQQDLNLIRIREVGLPRTSMCIKENAKASLKGKERVSSSGKGKANASSELASNNDVISKAALAQRARRQREREASRQLERNQIVLSERQLAQHTSPEREKSGEYMRPRQPRFFPALIPSRRRRAFIERARMKTIKGNSIQLTSVSTENTENAKQWTIVTNAPVSTSPTAILSQAPNLVDYPINGRNPPLVKNMLSQPKVNFHSLPPPRNLGLEPGRRRIQQGLHFNALGEPSSTAPCNFSLNTCGRNTHLIKPGERFNLELGRGRFQDIMGKYANCSQLKHRLLKPEICLKQTPMRPKYVHFVPVATTNYMAPVVGFSHGESSVLNSLGKPGIALHAVQSDSLKVSSEGPHPNGFKAFDDKQRTKQFFCLPNLLKHLDQSDLRDYKERLRHLPPAELSQHAVELEKRADQLTIEEGKEMQRLKALNIFGNLA